MSDNWDSSLDVIFEDIHKLQNYIHITHRIVYLNENTVLLHILRTNFYAYRNLPTEPLNFPSINPIFSGMTNSETVHIPVNESGPHMELKWNYACVYKYTDGYTHTHTNGLYSKAFNFSKEKL